MWVCVGRSPLKDRLPDSRKRRLTTLSKLGVARPRRSSVAGRRGLGAYSCTRSCGGRPLRSRDDLVPACRPIGDSESRKFTHSSARARRRHHPARSRQQDSQVVSLPHRQHLQTETCLGRSAWLVRCFLRCGLTTTPWAGAHHPWTSTGPLGNRRPCS